jgi:hypothetical protein
MFILKKKIFSRNEMTKITNICFNGKNLSKSFQENPDPKVLYLKGDLMQNQVVKVMVPKQLGPQ